MYRCIQVGLQKNNRQLLIVETKGSLVEYHYRRNFMSSGKFERLHTHENTHTHTHTNLYAQNLASVVVYFAYIMVYYWGGGGVEVSPPFNAKLCKIAVNAENFVI